MRFGLGLVLSALLHGIVFGALPPSPRAAPPRRIPLDIVEAPAPPPPPAAPPAEPAPPPPKPRPKRPPRADVVAVAPAPAKPGGAVAPDAGVPDGADIATDAGAEDAPAAADAGEALVAAGSATDAAPVAARPDPGVLDLRASVPPGARLVLALRTDRLRRTPWVPAVEAILAPLPDARTVLAGIPVVDTFDTVVIATANPRVVTATFVAGHTAAPRDDDALKRSLSRGAAQATWTDTADGAVGRRAARLAGDARVLLVPAPGWFLLVHPTDLPGGDWLRELRAIDDKTGDDPAVLALVTVADLPSKTLVVRGAPPLPAPLRATAAISVERTGMVITGAAAFDDPASARAFRDGVARARADALASFPARFLLRQLQLEGAATRLELRLDGTFVTFSTSLSNAEALALLERMATFSRSYFLGEP